MDVLEVYHREYQDNDLVCLDETSKQLVPAAARGTHGLRSRIPAKRGENLFMLFAPLEGWRPNHGPAHQDRLG